MMRNMGRSLANGITTAHGGTTESRGSAECVRFAMETGEVGVTSDAMTIKGEINKLGQVETQESKEVTETRESEEVTETQKLKETKEETTETENQELEIIDAEIKLRGGRII